MHFTQEKNTWSRLDMRQQTHCLETFSDLKHDKKHVSSYEQISATHSLKMADLIFKLWKYFPIETKV